MNLQKCKHGHYYDRDKFAKCPYCTVEDFKLKDTLRINGENQVGYTEKKKNKEKTLQDAVAAAMVSKQNMELEEVQMANLSDYENLPVGILVSLGNSYKGELLPLYVGDNSIYMEEDNVVVCCEVKDGIRIADITYHPEHNLFTMKPLADETQIQIGRMQLKNKIKLSSYDRIVIAGESFLFVPICGKQFHWSELS